MVPELGVQGAAGLHRRLSTETISRCIEAKLGRIEIWCHPDCSDPFFQSYQSNEVELHGQFGCDLGERMFNALDQTLRMGDVDSAILIGTDCPPIDGNYLQCAFNKLVDHEVVLGPAEDGGYGLIGMKAAHERVFADIEWGKSSVCKDSCRRLNELGLNYALLPLIWDVDRPEDLERYAEWKKSHNL